MSRKLSRCCLVISVDRYCRASAGGVYLSVVLVVNSGGLYNRKGSMSGSASRADAADECLGRPLRYKLSTSSYHSNGCVLAALRGSP